MITILGKDMVHNVVFSVFLLFRVKFIDSIQVMKNIVSVTSIFFENLLVAYGFYFVSMNVLGLQGEDRFILYIVSVATVHWLISNVASGGGAVVKLEIYRDILPFPIFFAFSESQVVPAFGWLTSIIFVFIVSEFGDVDFSILDLSNFFTIFLMNISFNFGFWSLSLLFKRHVKFISVYVLIFLVLIPASLSPTFFLLRDLPEVPSVLLTSLNPISHILAAYHSVLGYGQRPSYEVLPLMATATLVLGIFASVLTRRRNLHERNGEAIVVRNWRPRPDDMSVLVLATLLVSGQSLCLRRAQGRARLDVRQQTSRGALASAGFEKLISQPVSVLTDRKMIQLIDITVGLRGPAVVLDESLSDAIE